MNINLSNISDDQLLAELTQRGEDRRAQYESERTAATARAQARATISAANVRAERVRQERAAKDAAWASFQDMCAQRNQELRQQKIDGMTAEKRSAQVALWDLPDFSTLTTEAPEFDGRSGQDDIDSLTAIEFAATLYAQAAPRGSARSALKFQAARRVNASHLNGEHIDGRWTPIFHNELRRDGSSYRRYVSEQPHHVSDLHQIDGGETVIVAVHVDDRDNGTPIFHTMRCSKRWLDMRNIPQRNLWASLHPNRNIPMRSPKQFIYEPEAYIERFHADEADDLAWRWASEIRLTTDDDEQFAQM